jgi:hypothetical protein
MTVPGGSGLERGGTTVPEPHLNTVHPRGSRRTRDLAPRGALAFFSGPVGGVDTPDRSCWKPLLWLLLVLERAHPFGRGPYLQAVASSLVRGMGRRRLSGHEELEDQ